MLCAVANAALHDFTVAVLGIAFPSETFSGGVFTVAFSFGLLEGHHWFCDPESMSSLVGLLVWRPPAE